MYVSIFCKEACKKKENTLIEAILATIRYIQPVFCVCAMPQLLNHNHLLYFKFEYGTDILNKLLSIVSSFISNRVFKT